MPVCQYAGAKFRTMDGKKIHHGLQSLGLSSVLALTGSGALLRGAPNDVAEACGQHSEASLQS